MTYKPDVADLRESPALEIIRLLEAGGARVSFHDPLVFSLREEGLDTPFAELGTEVLEAVDYVVVATNHTSYDWDWVQTHVRLLVDTRYALGPAARPQQRWGLEMGLRAEELCRG